MCIKQRRAAVTARRWRGALRFDSTSSAAHTHKYYSAASFYFIGVRVRACVFVYRRVHKIYPGPTTATTAAAFASRSHRHVVAFLLHSRYRRRQRCRSHVRCVPFYRARPFFVFVYAYIAARAIYTRLHVGPRKTVFFFAPLCAVLCSQISARIWVVEGGGGAEEDYLLFCNIFRTTLLISFYNFYNFY